MGILPSGLADSVADEEELARFLPSASWFNAQGIKPVAFLPHGDERETSLFRQGAEPRDALWALGRQHVPPPRNIHGVAVVRARAVRISGLRVDPAEPPDRHAALVGWPWPDDVELRKAKQREMASELARAAQLLRPPV